MEADPTRQSAMQMARGLGLIIDIHDLHAAYSVGDGPFEFVAYTIAEHACADRSKDGNLTFLNVCFRGKNESEAFSFAAFEVAHLSTRVHSDDIRGNIFRIYDVG